MPRPDPPIHSRFKKGQTGNPGGKSSAQRQAEIRNAELATKIRGAMLEAVDRLLTESPDMALARIEPATLKLMKDAEDRGLGTPQASVSISNPDGSLKPEPVAGMVKELLQAIHAKPDAG